MSMPDKHSPEVGQTVFIVEDDASICEALGGLIESAGLATRHFSSAEEFLDKRPVDLSGCVLLDVRLPGMSGMELQGKLAGSGLSIPIIIMTGHGDIPMVRNALKAGAVEFLTKPFQDDELLNAIEHAFALDRAQRRNNEALRSVLARFQALSARECQVMELVTAGMPNKNIAEKLHLSIVTVKLYRRQVMDKMRAESLADLVKMRERIKSANSTMRG